MPQSYKKEKKYEKIATYSTVCFILHNFLRIESPGEYKDGIDYDTDEFSDIDAANELNQPIPGWTTNDAHRQQVMNYLLENQDSSNM